MTQSYYAPYLHITEDGHIWWLLSDAFRLGAGFLPVLDEGETHGTRLDAPNQQALVDEKTLTGAFGDASLRIARPTMFERDGFRYVDAAGFLEWLSQYISQTQAKIEFPNELNNQVGSALAKAAAERPDPAPQAFESLTLALEGEFDKPLDALPDALRQRVQKEFFPMPWDDLSADQRRTVTRQLDYQHDPATEADRQFWWDFFERKRRIEKRIEKWESVAAPTAGELATKESKLRELRQELGGLAQQERQPRADYVPAYVGVAGAFESSAAENFVAYPKAMRLLAEKLNATSDELAAWIFLGPDNGGIAAYLNANELQDPPRFHFGYFMGEDYLAPMMACWFRQGDIEGFVPKDRYITGEKLLERWGKLPGIRVEPFIRAKIAESRLLDLHPTFGGTRGTLSEDDGFPPLSAGLFALSNIEAIEAEDFEIQTPHVTKQGSPCQPVEARQIRLRFRVIRDEDQNDKWWKEKMANAERYGLLDSRAGEGKKGRGSGSLWKPAMIAGWLVDRHEKGKEGLAATDAGNALKQFPGCEELAEAMFPPTDSSP